MPDLPMIEPETNLRTDEARGGDTPHVVRYVLGISLALAVVALLGLALFS